MSDYRISLSFDQSTKDRIDTIKKSRQIKSDAEVFSAALSILAFLDKHEKRVSITVDGIEINTWLDSIDIAKVDLRDKPLQLGVDKLNGS